MIALPTLPLPSAIWLMTFSASATSVPSFTRRASEPSPLSILRVMRFTFWIVSWNSRAHCSS